MRFVAWQSLAIVSAFALVGCSNLKGKPAPTESLGAASTLGATNDPTKDFELIDGSRLRVWEDKPVSFTPPGATAGTFTISGRPSWAAFDTSTGQLAGTPRAAADAGRITITGVNGGVTTTYGPYAIEIVGDVMKEQQWHLINSGQTGYARTPGTVGQDIVQKHSVATNVFGAGVKIAISDTGTVINHPDLAANNAAATNRNYFNTYSGATSSWLGDPTPSYAQADNAHGTAVAGLAAAKGWNGIGGRGVASEAKFSAFLFIQAQGALAAKSLYDTALHDQFAGDFDVFNYSWGDSQCALTAYNSAYFAKLKYGVMSQRGGRGSIYVIAGGNDWVVDKSDCEAGSGVAFGNSNFTEALTTPYVIAVGANNADGISSSYASVGSALWVTAPGGEFGYSEAVSGAGEASEPALVTTDFPGCRNGLKSYNRDNSAFDAGGYPNTDCSYTSTMNGSSGATPIVSGVVALMLAIKPALTWRDVKYILATTAERVDAARTQTDQPGAITQLAGHTYELPWTKNAANHWFHDWYGFGRVDVDAAIAATRLYAANGLGPLVETNWTHDSGALNVSVPSGAGGATSTIPVSDSLTIEALQVRASVTGCAGSVGLELTSPSNTLSYLMNINSNIGETNIADHTFLSNTFLDENSSGNWTLRVVAGQSGCTPVLTNWRLNVFGH